MITVTILSSVLEGIAARAHAHPDEEICGAILRGEDIPIDNVVRPDQRARRFRMDHEQQMKVWEKWRRTGDLVIYHSHPSGTTDPSDDDKWVISRSGEITFVIFAVKTGWFKAYRFNGFSIVSIEIKSDVAYMGVSTQPDRRGSLTNEQT